MTTMSPAGPPAAIRLTVDGLRGTAPGTAPAGATIWCVDGDNGNAFAAWQRMGSPLNPTASQYAALEAASTMRSQPLPLRTQDGATIAATFDLPRQGVALVLLEGR